MPHNARGRAGDRPTARAGRGHPVPPEGTQHLEKPRQRPQAQVWVGNPSCPGWRFPDLAPGIALPSQGRWHRPARLARPQQPLRVPHTSFCLSEQGERCPAQLRTPKLTAPGPAPSRVLFPRRSWSFMSGKINQQKSISSSRRERGPPGKGGGTGQGPSTHPNPALGWQLRGSGKEKEKKEVKTASLLAGPAFPSFLPSSFLVFKRRRAGKDTAVAAREHRGPQPRQAQLGPGSSKGAQVGSRSVRCHPAATPRAPTKPPRACPSLGTGSAVTLPCGDRGDSEAGVTWVQNRGDPAGARASRSQLLRAPGQPRVPHFQRPRGEQGWGEVAKKKPKKTPTLQTCLFLSLQHRNEQQG